MAEFLKIGSEFVVGDEQWRGPAVLASDALFLLQRHRMNTHIAVHGGLVGGLIAGAIMAGIEAYAKRHAKDPTPNAGVLRCDLSELPAEVKGHPEWPLQKYDAGPMVVALRDSVTQMTVPWINNSWGLRCGDHRFRVVLHLWRVGATRRFLREHRWPGT